MSSNIMHGIIDTILSTVKNLMGAILSPDIIKSMIDMAIDMLEEVVGYIASIDLRELIFSIDMHPIIESTIPNVMKSLRPLIEMIINLLVRVLEIVGPLIKMVGPLLESSSRIAGSIWNALNKGLGTIPAPRYA